MSLLLFFFIVFNWRHHVNLHEFPQFFVHYLKFFIFAIILYEKFLNLHMPTIQVTYYDKRNFKYNWSGFLAFNPLSANPQKWSNTLKQFVGKSWRIAWVYLTFLRSWHLKGLQVKAAQ